MTPAFGYPGGKARIRQRLLGLFPTRGRAYVEPFAGYGNMFFLARKRTAFESWRLNDTRTASFLEAVRDARTIDIPERIRKEEWESSGKESVLLQAALRIYGEGGGFLAAGKSADGSWVSKDLHVFRSTVEAAKALLVGVTITARPWQEALENTSRGDFVYLDPPYVGTTRTGVGYDDIDHAELVGALRRASFAWVLSGYDNGIYRRAFGPPCQRIETVGAMSMGATGTYQRRVECAWKSG